MTEIELMRRDITKLGNDLARGLSGTTVLIEQATKRAEDLATRIDNRTREAHQRDMDVNRELGELKAQLASIEKMIVKMSSDLGDLPERVASVETAQKHVEKDITGKHDLVKEVASRTADSADKKEDRKLEEKKLRHEARKAKLQFWSGILIVSLPGIIALFWHLFRIPGEPPIPSGHPGSP